MPSLHGIEIRRTGAGEHWRLVGRTRALAGGFLLLALPFGLLATVPVARVHGVAHACLAMAALCVGLAVRVLRSGISLDADGLTGRGMVVSGRLRWQDVARFYQGVEELAPNKPAAAVQARLRNGRVVTVPGSRVEGWTWNLDRHRAIAAAVAGALEERRTMFSQARTRRL